MPSTAVTGTADPARDSWATREATTMSTELRPATMRSVDGVFEWDPAWDDVREFPIRIPCTGEEYLAIDVKLLVEYADGFLEVLPTRTSFHQLILGFLLRQL